MSAPILIAAVQHTLQSGPHTLKQLLIEHAPIWHQLGWSEGQVSLWLACLPGVRLGELPMGECLYALDSSAGTKNDTLADELVALLKKAGRPMPLMQLMGKLPTGVVVTEPMLRALAMQDARLELKGPLLKLA